MCMHPHIHPFTHTTSQTLDVHAKSLLPSATTVAAKGWEWFCQPTVTLSQLKRKLKRSSNPAYFLTSTQLTNQSLKWVIKLAVYCRKAEKLSVTVSNYIDGKVWGRGYQTQFNQLKRTCWWHTYPLTTMSQSDFVSEQGQALLHNHRRRLVDRNSSI